MAAKTNSTKGLTPAQSKTLETALVGIEKKVAKSDEQKKNLRRFADKWLRNKLGIRNTGPHSHGFSAEQRKTIREAVVAAFPSVAPKPRTAPAKAAPKASPRKRSTGRKSTAQLAKEQTARAQS